MRRRSVLVLSTVALLTACAREMRPLEFSAALPLQDPLPGQAFVYILRGPNDPIAVTIYANKARVATLPPERYTALSLRPGTYELLAVGAAENLPEGAAYQPTILRVAEGERRFVYTAQPTKSSSSISLFAAGRAGVVPLLLPTKTPTGARTWSECSESDAQGLLSISKFARPERDAL
jgi:hypothetical protein